MAEGLVPGLYMHGLAGADLNLLLSQNISMRCHCRQRSNTM